MTKALGLRHHAHPKAVALFAGCGGFSEGMIQAGFDVAEAVEKDKYACSTYRFNFPQTKLFEGEVGKFADLAAKRTQSERAEVDLVFGGPPCQGYSQIGTRDLKDPRNRLYRDFIRVLDVFRPKVFIMENVPNMAMLEQGMFRDAALEEFEEAGYGPVGCVRVVASDYGVPQERRRIFYFGVRSDLHFPFQIEEFVRPILDKHRTARPPTVSEAISDLPERIVDSGVSLPYPSSRKKLSPFQKEMRLDSDGAVYSQAEKLNRGVGHLGDVKLYNHHTKEIQERRLGLIKLLEPGMKADSLPKHIWNGARPEKWRRLHPDRVAHTLLAQMHRDMSEFVHPWLDRWITVREALRLQSFHDGFLPQTSEWQQLKQIGNAVPPLMARVVGLVGLEMLAQTRARNGKKPERPRRSATQMELIRGGSDATANSSGVVA